MNYLRTYESHGRDRTYQMISKDEFGDFIVNINYEFEVYTETEKTLLEKVRKVINPWQLPRPKLQITNHMASIRCGKGINNIVEIFIYKLSDEWFLINTKADFYKCDQFQGVIDYLTENARKFI